MTPALCATIETQLPSDKRLPTHLQRSLEMGQAANHALTPAQLAMRATAEVASLGTSNCHVLISCSKSKGSHPDLARNIYDSPMFGKSMMVAEGWGAPFSILSAKYGLLDPNKVIEPYDLTLKGQSKQFKAEWAARVDDQLRKSIDPNKRLIVLAGDDYYAPLIDASAAQPLNFSAPMRGLSLGNRLVFLNQCIRIYKRRNAIAQSYGLFGQLVEVLGLHVLRDLLAKDLPKQGVYFFFDDNELTEFSASIPRLVR